VLVTGATGFIGHHIVQGLSAVGFVPVSMYRDITKFQEIFPSFTGESLEWDLANPATDAISEKVRSCDAVIHAAAVLQEDNDGGRSIMEGNMLQLLHLLSVIPDSCNQIVFLSTTAVYGAIDEAAESSLPLPSNNYGVAKLAAERLASLFGMESGVNVAILRISAVYGPGMPEERAISRFVRSLLSGDPITLTPGAFEAANYINVRDVVAAVRLCLTAKEGANDIYNIADVENRSLADILERLETLTSIAAISEVAQIDHSPRGGPAHIATDHALENLGFVQTVTIENGLKDMIAERKLEMF
jgi:nucleoside-diphosphate-sugar epimerase